jgi:hypothetical protein
MCPEAHFQSKEQPKVTQSEIWRVWWLGDDRNAFFGEELLLKKQHATRCIIVMKMIPATCCAASSELQCATSAKLTCRNDQ